MNPYINDEPMTASSLEWLMGLVIQHRAAVDVVLGFQMSECLLYALGRIKSTPDEEVTQEKVQYQKWTGD